MTNADPAAHLNIREKESGYADVTSFSPRRNYSAQEHRIHRLYGGSNAALKSMREDLRSGMKGRRKGEEDTAKKSRLIVLFRGSWTKCLWVTSQAENCSRHAATLNIVFAFANKGPESGSLEMEE